MTVESLNRTLDQELAALIRGVSLECLVCGEFVLHVRGALACPECRTILAESEERIAEIPLPSVVQAGGPRAPFGELEESPDTTGQDAGLSLGAYPGGESRRKVEQKGDRLPRATEVGKGETVG